MIQLTKNQHDELAGNGKEPMRVIDPITNAEYVLVSAEDFARLRGMIDVDFHVSDAYPAIDRAFAEGWNAPKMDDHDRYEEVARLHLEQLGA